MPLLRDINAINRQLLMGEYIQDEGADIGASDDQYSPLSEGQKSAKEDKDQHVAYSKESGFFSGHFNSDIGAVFDQLLNAFEKSAWGADPRLFFDYEARWYKNGKPVKFVHLSDKKKPKKVSGLSPGNLLPAIKKLDTNTLVLYYHVRKVPEQVKVIPSSDGSVVKVYLANNNNWQLVSTKSIAGYHYNAHSTIGGILKVILKSN